jgi:hypothetical protein
MAILKQEKYCAVFNKTRAKIRDPFASRLSILKSVVDIFINDSIFAWIYLRINVDHD